MQDTNKIITIQDNKDWQIACSNPSGKSNEYFLYLHHAVTIDKFSLALLISALRSLPPNSAAVARVFDKYEPCRVINHGYYLDDFSQLWHTIHLTEYTQETQHPLIEETQNSALGAVLMTRDTATKVGFFDPNFETHLADVDWQLRANNLGVKPMLIRNASTFADPLYYPTELGFRYSIICDDLLLHRKHFPVNRFYPLWLFSILLFNIWRPLDFSISIDRNINLFKSLYWAISNYKSALTDRIRSADSLATLHALRDYFSKRFVKAA